MVVARRPLLSVESSAPWLWTVSATARAPAADTVESPRQIHAHTVVPARVGLQTALIQVHTGGAVGLVGAVVMETTPAVTVVRPGQVDTVGVVMTDGHALAALVHVSVTVVSGESWATDAGVRSHTRAPVPAAVFTKRCAERAVAHVSRFTGADVASHCVCADGFFITAQSRGALVMFCAGVLVDSCVPGDALTAVTSRDIDTDGVDLTEVSLSRALVDIFTVGVVSVR